ncbi:Fungalysin metallopeptidase-domain-containing protein [Syncephalis fuscata]|nr:Fungalysin metallopeptidase-domain-containing protein [Syncephalis fuscata]
MHINISVTSLILAFFGVASCTSQRINVKPIIPSIASKSETRSLSPNLSNYKPPISFVFNDPQEVALQFARSQLSVKDGDFVISSFYKSDTSDITHVYLQQIIKGVKVSNGQVSIHVSKANKVIAYNDSFFKDSLAEQPHQPAHTSQPNTNRLVLQRLNTWNGHTGGFVSPIKAFSVFASYIDQPFDAENITIVSQTSQFGGQSYLLKGVGFATQDIEVEQSYIQTNASELVPAWKYIVKMPINHFHVHITADGKSIISLFDLVKFASYRVVKAGENNPISTPRELLVDPADKIASPNGWHVQGNKKFTTTIGNNVYAQENYKDNDLSWQSNYRPDGKKDLKFDFPFDSKKGPKDNVDAAITNLFYMVNTLHDLFYRYGFNEKAGNFQEDNGKNGGKGGDAIIADALARYDLPASRSTRNDGVFYVNADGIKSRLTIYVSNRTNPDRDGDFENDIIAHEYGHGVSNRLTGGPETVSCLVDDEAAGMDEGWSDFYAYWLEMKPLDKPTKTFEMGKYTQTKGLRNYPYSTDTKINPTMYNYLDKDEWIADPHYIGEVWANMLYEMYWTLVNKLGFQEDKYSADVKKGNTLALKLVITGLTLQPCNPTFVTARNAILEAEKQLTGGRHACDIWKAFAKRGVGANANYEWNERTQSTELPDQCKK